MNTNIRKNNLARHFKRICIVAVVVSLWATILMIVSCILFQDNETMQTIASISILLTDSIILFINGYQFYKKQF